MKPILLLLTAFSLLFGAYSRDNTQETVYDDETGLTWQNDDVSGTSWNSYSFSDVAPDLNWTEAIEYCEALSHGGADDWRLPSINELLSITDLSAYSPAIDSTFQKTVSGGYWSSTTYARDTSSAWGVDFDNGNDHVNEKTGNLYVRCVRVGQIVTSPAPSTMVPMLYLLGF